MVPSCHAFKVSCSGASVSCCSLVSSRVNNDVIKLSSDFGDIVSNAVHQAHIHSVAVSDRAGQSSLIVSRALDSSLVISCAGQSSLAISRVGQ